VVSLDLDGKPTTQTEFNAVLTELKIPAFDASSSKAEGFFTLKLAGDVRVGAAPAARNKALIGKPKVWTTSNFLLEIDGLETKRVMKLDGLTLKTPSSAEAAPLSERSPLKITASDADLPSWQKWQQAAAAGNAKPKEGRIVCLDATLKNTLAEIKLHGLAISALRSGGSASSGPAKFEADLSYGSLELIVPAVK
jgi:hypothetical protein